jgi:4-amino-4-deoxy-L-arabinose transferase-like glycosyltransferase
MREGTFFMSQKKIHGASAIIVLGALVMLCFYNLGQPVLADYFEAASALVSAEMFTSHFWLPMQDNSAGFCPAVLYWSQLAGYHLFGMSALGARFVTAIAAVFMLFVLYKAAARTLGKRTALQAVLITAGSLLFIFAGRQATGDILATLFLLLNMVLCWSAVEAAIQEKKGADFLLWAGCIFTGLAMLSGGLMVGLISVLTAFFYLLTIGRLALFVRARWLFPGFLLLIITAFSPCIILAVTNSTHSVSFCADLISRQRELLASGMVGYGSKVLFGFLLLLLGMMPWCCYLGLAVTTSSLFGKEQSSQRFVRLFVLFSLLVVGLTPLGVHGVSAIAVAAVPGAALLLAQLFERIDVQYSKRWILAGWLTIILFACLTLLTGFLPFLANRLAGTFSEFGQAVPLLSSTVDTGYVSYAAAGILACLTYILYRGVKKRKVYGVFNALTLSAVGLVFVAVVLLQPVYDRLIVRPVSTLALEGVSYTPEDGAMLLYAIGERPSAAFYAKRKVLVKAETDHIELQRLFDEKVVQVGISTGYFLKRLGDFGVEVKELKREHGYVLFTIE